MSTETPTPTTHELAKQFERQGIRSTDDDDGSPAVLWCSFCTAYLSDKKVALKTQISSDTNANVSSAVRAREPSLSQDCRADAENAAPVAHEKVTLRATRNAILEHCATRLHLNLYEHHVQEGLRQWCPVELHGYRMLLDHHCVYPGRMFGDGRMLMDFSIPCGMLLGQDVCGGVKLWPQHRYAVAELVLPAARSGVREVWVPPTEAAVEDEESGSKDKQDNGATQKRRRTEGHHLQLLHEESDIPEAVARAFSEDAVTYRTELPRSRVTASRLLECVPRYTDEFDKAPHKTLLEKPLSSVLDATNASITCEAKLREQRRRYSLSHNVVQRTACDEEAKKPSKKSTSSKLS